MKFVHLTPQPSISRVRRNGIRLGNGRRGRGVYVVPLMLMRRVSYDEDFRVTPADARSSVTLWQWLRRLGDHHHNLAAVVFGDSRNHWPADLYVMLDPVVGTAWLDDLGLTETSAMHKEIQFVRDSHEQGYCAELKLSIPDSNVLGSVLHAIQTRGHTTSSRYDDSVELVLPNPVPPNLIERIAPLYRSNQQFKRDRRRDPDAD